MRAQWIVSTIFIAVFVNIFILYFLLFTVLSERRAASDQQSPTPEMQAADSQGCEGCEERIAKLEQSIDIVNDKVNELEAQSGSSPSVVTVKQQSTSSSTAASSAVSEITIPFGSGETYSKDWVDVPGMNAYIDTKRYSSISSVRFEAVLRIPNAQGWVHARLYNKTDDRPVWNSEVVSETDKSVLKQSEPITLEAGNKLYQVQLKSTIGVQALIDSGRIKIQL